LTLPPAVLAFLAGDRIVVAGVSRTGNAPANAIFRRLRDTGHDAIPVNPRAREVEGCTCFPDLASVPGEVHGVMIVTPPDASVAVVREALARGVRHLWFHRSFGSGSVSEEAVALCRAAGVAPIVGGCPLMYCGAVDPAHRVFRWWLTLRGRIVGLRSTSTPAG
jgi:predicted CoA-binding protein